MKERLKSFALLIFSLFISLLLGELIVRIYYFEGLSNIFNTNATIYSYTTQKVDALKYAKEYSGTIDSNFFNINPAPHRYGHYRKESQYISKNFTGEMQDDRMKIWNLNFLKSLKNSQRKNYTKVMISGYADEEVYAFESNTDSMYPVYRYLPNAMLPDRENRFNSLGLGGSDIPFKKGDSTIRIAFLGGSTTQQAGIPFAYPDYIGAWLNAWARLNGYNVNFEVINAGRVALRSMDFAAIMRYEVAPLQPDIVLYYEGRNQFNPEALLPSNIVYGKSYNPITLLISHSILAQSFCAALNVSPYKLIENQKPQTAITWPENLSIANPVLYNENLPLNLSQIVQDLDSIRSLSTNKGATMFIASFPMVIDDTILYNKNYAAIYGYWLNSFPKIPLKVIDTLNKYENRVFKQYASIHKLPYIDVANALVQYPDLFIDGIHLNEQGLKYQAWVVFNNMLPKVKALLDEGRLPIKWREGYEKHPYINDESFLVDLDTLQSTP